MSITNKDERTKGIKQYHIGMVEGDVAEYILLPGDPFRTDIIAQYMDDVKLVAHKREHKTYTGYYKGSKSICYFNRNGGVPIHSNCY